MVTTSLDHGVPAPLHAHASQPAAHTHSRVFDRLGAILGVACALHCIAMPLVFGILPALGLQFLADHTFDLVIVVFAAIFAFFAARSGLRSHGDRRFAFGFGAAVALLALGHALGDETLAGRIPSILGGLTLALVHFLNLRASGRACPHPQHSSEATSA